MKKRIDDLITTDGLRKAARQMRKKRRPGIDGVTPEQFQTLMNETDLADDLMAQLAPGSYRPNLIALRHIPKPNGKLREIFVPTVQDGVVQAAFVAGLTPETESRFLDNSYGFRPNRNVFGAVLHASRLIQEGYTVCYSVDLQTFFPNVERERMRKLLRDFNLDSDTLKLINSFMTAGVIGAKVRYERGIPAGIPLAPLLANIYLHPLDLALRRLGIPFIRYADDVTLFFRSKEDCLFHIKFWGDCEQRFGIVVNREKTKIDAEGIRPVLGFNLDEYGGITVSRTVIYKIEESLSGLLAKPQFLLSEKIKRIRQRMAFSRSYYRGVQNFPEFEHELDQILERLQSRILQFPKLEIVDALNVPVDRLDEYELLDEREFLANALRPSQHKTAKDS
jgi:RNA-directed DNA polymerase